MSRALLPDRRKIPLGWDDAVDLERPPATVPDPAEVEVPDDLRRQIEGYIARYPEKHSAALPALAAAQQRARLVLAARRSPRSRW